MVLNSEIKILPPQEYLKACFEYDPEDGKLTWKTRPQSHFEDCDRSSVYAARAWNNKMSGRVILTSKGNGYIQVRLKRDSFYAHRIAWKIFHGDDPHIIDHINGVRDDNRISNLVSVDALGNSKNCKLSSNNESGANGVFWSRDKDKWAATIGLDYKSVYLGYFTNLGEAKAARKGAEKVLSYADRHGKVLEQDHDNT